MFLRNTRCLRITHSFLWYCTLARETVTYSTLQKVPSFANLKVFYPDFAWSQNFDRNLDIWPHCAAPLSSVRFQRQAPCQLSQTPLSFINCNSKPVTTYQAIMDSSHRTQFLRLGSLYKKIMIGCCEAKINVMWLAHVVRMRLSQEVETFSRLGRAMRAVQISSM